MAEAVVWLCLTWVHTFLFKQGKQETNCPKMLCLVLGRNLLRSSRSAGAGSRVGGGMNGSGREW